MNIDLFAFDRAQAQQAISNPLDGTNVSKHSSHFKEADAASLEDMIQRMDSKEGQQSQKMLEDFYTKQRAYVKEYREKEYTTYSGVTNKGTSFTLNLVTPEDMKTLGYYTITFTNVDGYSQTFNLNDGAGFRELEDGKILQFGSQNIPGDNNSISNALIGTEGDDILIVDNTKNVSYVDGKAGNDIIVSLGYYKGVLNINGGDGDDQIFVSQKSIPDFYRGVNIHGDSGNDSITYEGTLNGKISGEDGNDTITVLGNVNGSLIGGAGDDVIEQKYQHNKSIYVKEGGIDLSEKFHLNDTPSYVTMNGLMDGGEGNDNIVIQGGAIAPDGVILGGKGNDTITITSINGGVTGVAGNIDGEEGNDTISISGKSITSMGSINGGIGDDLIQIKAEKDIYLKLIDSGEGDDKIIIDGETIDMMGSTLELGEGNNSVTIKAKTKFLADFLRIYGGSGDDKLEIDAKLIEMMDAYINTKGGNDRISISGEKVNIKGAIITGGEGENGISINAEELEADGSRIDRGASIQEGVAYRQAESGKNTPPEEIRNKVVSLTSSILRLPESQSMFVKLVETIGEEKNSSVSLARKLDGLADTLNAELLRQSGKQVNARI